MTSHAPAGTVQRWNQQYCGMWLISLDRRTDPVPCLPFFWMMTLRRGLAEDRALW